VTPGADNPNRGTPEQVADYTMKLLTRRVPPSVPGARRAFAPAWRAELAGVGFGQPWEGRGQ